MPFPSGAEVLLPYTEATGVADSMIEAQFRMIEFRHLVENLGRIFQGQKSINRLALGRYADILSAVQNLVILMVVASE
jgi:hypothetical protein